MFVEDPGLSDGERVKLLDFGIAKLATEGLGPAKQPTVTGKLIGTPRYMSPEQCRGQRDLDGKSDVYSLGVVLYELLAGRPPFVGMGDYDVLAKHLYDPPVPLGELRSSVSKPLAALIDRMLDKKKENRPPMKEVFAALKGYRRAWVEQGESGVATPTPTSIDRVVPSARSSDPTESGFESARVPAPAPAAAPLVPQLDPDAAAEAAPTVRAPTVRPRRQGPRGANPPAPGPPGPEPTLIAGGPNATTVPVAVFNRKAQEKLRRAQFQRQLSLVGVSAAFLLVLIIYLICR